MAGRFIAVAAAIMAVALGVWTPASDAKTYVATNGGDGRHSLEMAMHRANRHEGADRLVIASSFDLQRPITARDDLTIIGRRSRGHYLYGGDPIRPREHYGTIRFNAPGKAHFAVRGLSMLYIALVARDPLVIEDVRSVGGREFDYAPEVGLLPLQAGRVDVVDSEFTGWNKAIEVPNDNTVNLRRTRVEDNGVGVHLIGGRTRIRETIIDRNSPGGGVSGGGDATISRSTLSNNEGVLGGGLSLSLARGWIRNSTVSGNSATGSDRSAGNGGGIFIGNPDDFSIEATTITDNQASDAGGGLYVTSTTGPVDVQSSIIGGNTAASGADCAVAPPNALRSDGGSVFGTPSCAAGAGDLVADPLLAPLGDNGGPTPTHGLLSGSPAIDHGVDLGLPTDQRGVARDSHPDSGSFERR
jgi:hypothetical protein